MGDMVIVAYRPKPGKEDELLALTRDHVPALRKLGLATERATLAMRSRKGIIVEVFEWQNGAIDVAHTNPDVLGCGNGMALSATMCRSMSFPRPAICSRNSSRSS